MAATASNSAVPSIFMVAPSGKTKLDTERFTPSSSSQVLIETGRVAALDEVLNATIKGRAI